MQPLPPILPVSATDVPLIAGARAGPASWLGADCSRIALDYQDYVRQPGVAFTPQPDPMPVPPKRAQTNPTR